MKFNYDDSLGSHELTIDLRRMFPRPWRSGVHRHFILFAVCTAAIILSITQLSDAIVETDAQGVFFDMLRMITFNTLFAGILIISLTLLYEEFHHRGYYYGIDAGNLIIVTGVFVKRRSSYPLDKITDVYLTRGWIDLLFGLYNVNFSTANSQSFQHGRVEELNRQDAVGLQELLAGIVGRKYKNIADQEEIFV